MYEYRCRLGFAFAGVVSIYHSTTIINTKGFVMSYNVRIFSDI